MTIYFYNTGETGRLLRKSKMMCAHSDSATQALLGLRPNPETEKHLVLVMLEGVKLDPRLIQNVAYNEVPVLIIEATSIFSAK